MSERSWRTGTVDLVVRVDHISVWLGLRTLACMDRTAFRRWLDAPVGSFHSGDVDWLLHGSDVRFRIDGGRSYPVPPQIVTQLVSVI